MVARERSPCAFIYGSGVILSWLAHEKSAHKWIAADTGGSRHCRQPAFRELNGRANDAVWCSGNATCHNAARVQITEGPTLESFRNDEAIITWTSNNPGGADEHFGIVSYGTDRNQLNQTAESHFRLNRNHSYTVFRVRVDGLKPGITYYYTVDSMGGDGTRDGVESTIYHFTTPADRPEP